MLQHSIALASLLAMNKLKSIRRALSACIMFTAVAGVMAAPAKKEDPNKWEPAMKKFAELDKKTSPPQHGILFVGSSSIVGWDVNKFFPDLPVLNRGFGGSQVSDLNKHFDQVVTPYKPETIVFYSGDNDVKAGKTSATIAADVKTFVGKVRATLPDTHIFIIPPKPSISRWSMWPAMQDVAKLERELAKPDPKITIIDPSEKMLGEDGKPRPELLKKDKLHMTEEGYVIWSDMLRPHLENTQKIGTLK